MVGVEKKISLILTIYQQKDFLPLILYALEQQTYKGPWELMVCDDGSSDEIRKMISESELAQRIEVGYFWQQDCGFRAAKARNAGIHCTCGNVLVFLDGDAIPGRNFLLRHAAAHEGKPRVVCGSRSYLFLDKYSLVQLAETLHMHGSDALAMQSHLPTRSFQLARLRGKSPWSALCGCNFSVVRSQDVIFDDTYVGWGIEDYELSLRLWSEHGYEIMCDPDNIVYHLEKTPSAVFHPLRPRSPEAIACYVANVIRISERYPYVEMGVLWQTLSNYTIDCNGQWQTLHSKSAARSGVEMYQLAKAWQKAYTPPSQAMQ